MRKIGVELGLPLVELLGGRSQLAASPDGFDLLDDPGAVRVPAEAVNAPSEAYVPALVLELQEKRNLAAIGGVQLEGLFLVAAVDRLAEPHALVAAAVGEAQTP